MRTILRLALVAGLFSSQLVFAPAFAAVQQAPASVVLSAWLVTTDKAGKEALSKAQAAKPGDVIEYRAQLDNVSRTVLHAQALTLPVPAGTAYVASSAQPARVLASADGGKSFEAVPLMRVVRNAQGKDEKIAVPLDAYHALRWTVPDLPAGKNFVARARVRVVETPTVVAKTEPASGTRPVK